jgi:hypothetical protein
MTKAGEVAAKLNEAGYLLESEVEPAKTIIARHLSAEREKLERVAANVRYVEGRLTANVRYNEDVIRLNKLRAALALLEEVLR